MYFNQNERTAVFIDGANLHATVKGMDFDIDYKKLLNFFKSESNLLRALYYTAIIEDDEFSALRPLIDWLDYNGYTLVTKPAKEFTDAKGRKTIKGNMDIDLAVDVMELAPHLDHIVIFSGDGDFCPLIKAVQQKGCKVSVISSTNTSPPMAADEVRRRADQFIELSDLESKIGKARKEGFSKREFADV